MLGAILGDTIGSVYEFRNINTSDFQPLFHPEAEYTDDSVMSIAVADWLLNTDRSQYSLECKLVEWATKYPNPMGSYGAGFSRWLFHPEFLGGTETITTTSLPMPANVILTTLGVMARLCVLLLAAGLLIL